jgi:hypothetical protein
VTGNASTSRAAEAAAPETVDSAPDWRALLDLLEERTGVAYDDLWRTWVARDTDLPLLDARRAARTEYDKVVEEAGDWLLPRALRDAMRAWRFDQAQTMLDDATAVLDDRTQITTDAAAAGLTVPDTLRMAFESPDGFASAAVEASAELAAIRGYSLAVEARRTAADSIEALGLWGLNPDGDLDRARTLFAAGDVAGSVTAAGAAQSAWTGAAEAGRARLTSIGILALALLLGLVILAIWLRGRRRRVPTPAFAPAGSNSLARTDPYATLAASSDPAGPVEVGDDGSRGAKPD